MFTRGAWLRRGLPSPRLPDFAHLSRYDLLAAALQIGLLGITLATALVYLVKRSGNRTGNRFFALLLAAFGGCIAALILEHLGLPARFPRLRYLPIWLSLSIGPAWFYYVKLSLFPAYLPRWSDLKHAVFPISQLLYTTVTASGVGPMVCGGSSCSVLRRRPTKRRCSYLACLATCSVPTATCVFAPAR